MWGLLLIKEVRERSQVIQCLQQWAGSLNIKWLLLIKENQISQAKEFSIFLCVERFKSMGSLKSFLWYAPETCQASVLCFYILSFFRAHFRGWLQFWWLLDANILSFLFSSGLTISSCLWLKFFAYWYGTNIPFLRLKTAYYNILSYWHRAWNWAGDQ